jgi:glyoxylate utilization-related uncharacterized protein
MFWREWLRPKPGGHYEAVPDAGGTDVLVMVICGVLALTVEGQSSQLEAGSAGHIPSGASYIVANPAPGGHDLRAGCTSRPPADALGTPVPALGRLAIYEC